MARDYRITKISGQPPREYFNQKYNSTTYYVKVMLEGHSKPVEIGKKDPQSLKVGDIVYGDITPTTYETDNFKSAQKGFSGGGGTDLTPLQSKLEAIHGDLKLLMSWYRADKRNAAAEPQNASDEPFPGDEDRPVEQDEVIMDIGDEPINLDDIPF